MNLAYRDIRHNLGRFLLTCVGLGLLLGVVLAMIGIYRGLVVEALTIARAPAVDLWVVEANTRGPFAEASRIPEDTRDAIARIAGVAAAGGITYQTVEVQHRDRKLRLYVIGYEPTRPGGPPDVVQGRRIGRNHYELVADRSAGLELDDRIRLGRGNFAVVGLTDHQVSLRRRSGGLHHPAGCPEAAVRSCAARRARPDCARHGRGRARTRSMRWWRGYSRTASAETVAETVRRWKHLAAITQEEQENILTRSLVDRARRQIGLFTSCCSPSPRSSSLSSSTP